jgi:hypothetical protein
LKTWLKCWCATLVYRNWFCVLNLPQVTPIIDGDGARVRGGGGSFMKGAEEKSLSLPNLEKVHP